MGGFVINMGFLKMARITVEDCLGKVGNRFELVLLATKRARQIARGVEPLVAANNDKPTVIALREIAEGKVDKAMVDEQERLEAEQAAHEAALQAAEAIAAETLAREGDAAALD